jgi:hypothetical protein
MTLLLFLMVAAMAEQGAARRRAAASAAAGAQAHTGANEEVAPTLTPVTQGQVLGAIMDAWQNATGQQADWGGIVILASQAAEETAGFAKLYDYNLGNITHAPGDGYDYNHRPEVPVASMVFRVYPDLESGAADLVEWAIKHGAEDAIQNGDLSGYMNALRAGCYLGCIGNETPTGVVSQSDYDAYEASIEAWMNRLENVVPEAPPVNVGQAIGIGTAVLGLAAVGALIYAATRKEKRAVAAAAARKIQVEAVPVQPPVQASGASTAAPQAPSPGAPTAPAPVPAPGAVPVGAAPSAARALLEVSRPLFDDSGDEPSDDSGADEGYDGAEA